MKIAMMTNNYKPYVAGVPISIERLAAALRRQGHQVVVFAPSYDDQEPEEDIVRYRSLLRGVCEGFSVPDRYDPVIEQKFREGQFDVIHVHHPMLIGSTARHLSRKYHVPLVFTYHTRYEQYLHYIGLSCLKPVMPAYVRHCMRDCDLVVAPTPKIRDYLEEIQADSTEPAKIRVLPTGITKDSFYPDEEESRLLRKELLGDRKYLFCTVARLAREKNLEFLIDSLKLRKQICGSDFKLALIGYGPERAALEKYAGEAGLSEEILFVGKVPNDRIRDYCHAADLFLFASQSETQGIVLLEAMAAGTPVLALRGTGTEDVVVNGVNGYMTEMSKNASAQRIFADKLMDILEKDKLEDLRRGALETAEKYRDEELARRAHVIYAQAICLHREKEQTGYGNRNHGSSMVYFQERGRLL